MRAKEGEQNAIIKETAEGCLMGKAHATATMVTVKMTVVTVSKSGTVALNFSLKII